MNLTPATLSLALGVLNLLALLIGWMRLAQTAAARFARLELKTETMWNIVILDALAEATKQGMIRRKSPFSLNGQVARAFGELEPRMRSFYHEHRLEKVSDNEVILLLAREYADELLEEVCIPLGINLRMGLLAAVHMVRERPIDEEEKD